MKNNLTISKLWKICRQSAVAATLLLFGGHAAFADPDGLRVTDVEHSAGMFSKTGPGKWVEKNAAGETGFRFTEGQKDASQVVLIDESRAGVQVTLYPQRNEIWYADANSSFKLYDITNLAARDFATVNESIATEMINFKMDDSWRPSDPVCSIPKTWEGRAEMLNGSVGNDILDGIIPDFYYTKFESACRNHDFCYGSPWVAAGYTNGQELCDDRFLDDMRAICNKTHNEGSPNWIGCYGGAQTIYEAVAAYGDDAFNGGQRSTKGRLIQAVEKTTSIRIDKLFVAETTEGGEDEIYLKVFVDGVESRIGPHDMNEDSNISTWNINKSYSIKASFKIEVWEEDNISDDFIGELSIPIGSPSRAVTRNMRGGESNYTLYVSVG